MFKAIVFLLSLTACNQDRALLASHVWAEGNFYRAEFTEAGAFTFRREVPDRGTIYLRGTFNLKGNAEQTGSVAIDELQISLTPSPTMTYELGGYECFALSEEPHFNDPCLKTAGSYAFDMQANYLEIEPIGTIAGALAPVPLQSPTVHTLHPIPR